MTRIRFNVSGPSYPDNRFPLIFRGNSCSICPGKAVVTCLFLHFHFFLLSFPRALTAFPLVVRLAEWWSGTTAVSETAILWFCCLRLCRFYRSTLCSVDAFSAFLCQWCWYIFPTPILKGFLFLFGVFAVQQFLFFPLPLPLYSDSHCSIHLPSTWLLSYQ